MILGGKMDDPALLRQPMDRAKEIGLTGDSDKSTDTLIEMLRNR